MEEVKSQLKKINKVSKSNEIFADPTYDLTFKMLFATAANKTILISFLNNLLDFNNSEEIKSLEIINPLNFQSNIEVKCKTFSNETVSVEIQRYKKNSSQAIEGNGKENDPKFNDFYVLVLGINDFFVDENKFIDDSDALFEKTVRFTCPELDNLEMPGYKMHWKIFELERFKRNTENTIINNSSSLKNQWLDFFVKCGKNLNIPENVDEIIKKCYKIMEIANWKPEDKFNYSKMKESEFAEQLKMENKLRLESLKWEFRGNVKSEINLFKVFKQMEKEGLNITKYYDNLKYKDEIQNYFDNHPNFNNETDSQIFEEIFNDEKEGQIIQEMDLDIQADL